MIPPEIGRVVHFFPGENESIQGPGPLASQITFVENDRSVNVRVHGSHGGAWTRLNVPLLQDEDKPPLGKSYCKWMPYQLGQAGKTAEAKAEAKAGVGKQRLTEFFHLSLSKELTNRKITHTSPRIEQDGRLMTVDCEVNGYKVPLVVPVEMVMGDGNKDVMASNFGDGVVREVNAMKQQDGKKTPAEAAPGIPGIPAAPASPGQKSGFGED